MGPLGWLTTVSQLRFLGVAIHQNGTFQPWDPLTTRRRSVAGILDALSRHGFACYPAAISHAVTAALLPATTYGAELWGLRELSDMVFRARSPYDSKILYPVIHALKV